MTVTTPRTAAFRSRISDKDFFKGSQTILESVWQSEWILATGGKYSSVGVRRMAIERKCLLATFLSTQGVSPPASFT